MRTPGRMGEDAVGQVVGFLVAGTIFLATVASVLLATRGAGADRSPADEARQGIAADSLAEILVGSAGAGWEAGPDALQRLGLANANMSGLDPDSLEALRGAMEQPGQNGKVDYDEALASLGLDPDGSAGFHLRVYPVGLDDLYDVSLEDVRTAYIGDWSSLASVKLTLPLGTQEQMAVKANAALNLSMFSTTAQERAALRNLGLDYNDRVYVTLGTPAILVDYAWPLPDLPLLTVLKVPLLEGDVYPDHAAYLEAVLPDRMDRYDVIVVGSGVDHAAFKDPDLRQGFADFVGGGGTILVFGSAAMDDDWLQPLFKSGVSTVNGAPTAPDAAHPSLKEPNVLEWTSYDSHGLGWDIKSTGSDADYDDFSHVVIQDGEDVLALSKEGAFGDGRIVLTTFRPRDIALELGLPEAQAFIENMLVYSDRTSLYLDYGGEVPANHPVALSVRQSWLWDPVLGQVPVRVEVLAWE